MAYKIIRQLFNQFQPGLELTAIIESASDLHGLPVCAPGSRAYIIGSAEFEMGASGAWVSKSDPFSKPIEVTLGSALSYTGSELTQAVASVKNGSTTLTLNTDYEISGNKATEPGVYYLSIIGKGDYSGIHVVPFTVSRASLTKPTKTAATYSYNGSNQTLALTGFDSEKMDISGNQRAYPGSYEAIVTIKDTERYQWQVGQDEDPSDEPITIAWSIGRASLTKPTKHSNKTYTGEELTVTLTNFDESTMTVYGDKGVEPGDYLAVVDIKLKQLYKWSGAEDDDEQLSIPWTINKANGSVTVDPDTLSVAVGESKTSTVTVLGTGAVSVLSSSEDNATARIEGNTVTVTGVASGSATVTVSAEADEHYKAASATITVTVSDA